MEPGLKEIEERMKKLRSAGVVIAVIGILVMFFNPAWEMVTLIMLTIASLVLIYANMLHNILKKSKRNSKKR